MQGYLKYPPNLQVYNKRRLDRVKGIKELIIRRTEPVFRSSLIEGGREIIFRRPEVLDSTEYGYMLISFTFPMCRFIMSSHDLSKGGRQLIIRCVEWVVRV